MSSLLPPLHLLLMMFAGWVNRHQLNVIEYLQEENRVLKERLGGRRIRFTDAERRRLARKARLLGRKVLNKLETLVTPDTLLRCPMNAFAERFVRSIKEECLSRMIFFGQASLQHAIRHFMAHYHAERNHQGLGNLLLQRSGAINQHIGSVKRNQRLGGILSFYHREAA